MTAAPPGAMDSLAARDLRVLWHPCTQMKEHEELAPVAIRAGRGVWLEDDQGNRYLDAISSWWVNLFGHSHPAINAAVADQLERLEHVIFAGFTHEPGVRLAERLIERAPPGLARCFYADNGSSAIEVALKMSFQYWLNLGETRRTRFIALEHGYHGETLGALAVGHVPLYRDTYAPLLMDVTTAPSPGRPSGEPGESAIDHAARQFAELERLLARHAGEVCAVVIEPLVQCAGGMRMYDPAYLGWLREACDRHRVHLIADEIAVGFGRTGTFFACEQAPITPDFLCLSKGLTGGYLPLSAVLTREEVYAAFYDDYASLKAFLHSHSYTGNPLACRAALATLDLFDETDVLAANRHLARRLADGLGRFAEHPHVGDVRQTGMIAAVELVQDKHRRTPYPWQERHGLRVHRAALRRGLLLRPLGPVVYFMPPYVITPEQIDWMLDVAWTAIDDATRD